MVGSFEPMARRRAPALFAAVLCALCALAVWALAFHTGIGRSADVQVLKAFGRLDELAPARVADQVARLCNPLPYALLCAVVLLHTLRTRGWRGVLVALAILGGANVLTQILKDALAVPRPAAGEHVHPASWPSGHATAAMALALCALLAAPRRARAVTALAGALFAVVLLGWHFPSDTVGGFAIAGMVAGLVLALGPRMRSRLPAGAG
jgi:membrane-associated phospholipid phosphatase